ncbi:MAG: hypothetical protein IK088_04160 [Lachnospiraceae bacterium]|nr:hypothetical protein [Lachnospiraceae bacterium]
MRSHFLKMIREIASEEGARVKFYSDGWGIRLKKGKKTAYIVGYHFPLNSSGVKELLQDKCLTYEVLKSEKVPAAVHLFLPHGTETNSLETAPVKEQLREWIRQDGFAVIKNNYGTGGHQVYRVRSEEEIGEALSAVYQKAYAAAVSPFYEIREEYRVVMLDGQPMLTIRKERESVTENGVKRYVNWKHNLGQGATGVVVTDRTVLKALYRLAKRTVSVLGARFASVDIIDTEDGLKVLEVNSGVMLEHFAGQDDECYRLAKNAYHQAVKAILEG